MVLGLSLIVLQAVVRGVAVYHGWFYGDDFEFLQEATRRGVSLGYLMQPHDSQLMPAGILSIWGVAHTGVYNWPLAATIILVFQVLASTACWSMLCAVFGVRWLCLGLLAVYMFSTLTLTAFMWWSAAINHVPTQLAFFVAVALHVRYLRTRRLLYGVLAAVAVVFGLLFYVKALLITVPIVMITFCYFTEQRRPLLERIRGLALDHWRVWAVYGVVVLVYLQYYVRNVPNPISADNAIPYGELLDTMIRVSLGPALLGGPWRWSDGNPPLGLVSTPDWAVTASWTVLGVAVALIWRARRADWRAFGILVPFLAVSFFLVARGRAGLIGGSAGLELRYLADSAPVLVLFLGLLLAGRQGIVSAPSPPSPVTADDLPGLPVRAIALGTVVILGTTLSNVQYMRFWGGAFPAKAYVQSVVRQSNKEPLRLVDKAVPQVVLAGTSFPGNLPSRLFQPLGQDRVSAATVGNDLKILRPSGEAATATVAGAQSRPGPLTDCGYPIRETAIDIGFVGSPPEFFWWLEMSYAANEDGAVELNVGGGHQRVKVQRGLHRLFVQGEGSIAELSFRSLTSGVVLCVDQVSVGDIAPLDTQ